MQIRRETRTDYTEIYNLVKLAFETAEVSNGKEQDFVVKLRDSENYIPELALVAESDNRIIGHIMLTKTYIMADAEEIETLILAPLAVDIEYRKKGVGSGLIKKSFELAAEMGYKSVLLVGNPDYYSRFGFKQSKSAFSIRNTNNIPDQYVMACELIPNSLKGFYGTITFDCG